MAGSGTLYPDVIESVSQGAERGHQATTTWAACRKDEHEAHRAARELFKDEVRQGGRELGMPESVIWRQPFPGPGLAIRVIGSDP